MMETEPVRVMVVDDHTVVRSGLTAVLLAFGDLEMVGEAGSGEEAVGFGHHTGGGRFGSCRSTLP